MQLTLLLWSLGAKAPQPPEAVAAWDASLRGKQLVLITPARAKAWGPDYDPFALNERSDLSIEFGLHSAPYCPSFGHFCCWTTIGTTPWVPYNGGCSEPDALESAQVEGSSVIWTGAFWRLDLDDRAGTWELSITPMDDETFEVRWRRPGTETWTAPVTLVQSPETTWQRLQRWRQEHAARSFKAAGHAVADPKRCTTYALDCDDALISVCDTSTEGQVLVLQEGKVRTATGKRHRGMACTEGPIPGALATDFGLVD